MIVLVATGQPVSKRAHWSRACIPLTPGCASFGVVDGAGPAVSTLCYRVQHHGAVRMDRNEAFGDECLALLKPEIVAVL